MTPTPTCSATTTQVGDIGLVLYYMKKYSPVYFLPWYISKDIKDIDFKLKLLMYGNKE